MNIIVKQATIENLDELSILFDEYRIFYKQESDINGAKDFLFDRFEHLESVIFIAVETESNKIAGFTQLYPKFSSVSMQRLYLLNDLYVSENYRRNGIGKSLLDAAKSYAITMKAKGIELAALIDNANAQKLYENNGYKKIDDHFHYFMKI